MKKTTRPICRLLALLLVFAAVSGLFLVPTVCTDPLEPLSSSSIMKKVTPEANPFSDLYRGDRFLMGYYGGEEILWRVLDRKQNSILVISEYGLDSKLYHNYSKSVTWQTSHIRSWLNDEFLYSAFSSAQRSYILDTWIDSCYSRLFLLSISEVKEFFPSASSRICRATSHAVQNDAYVNSATGGSWWLLRTPGETNREVASVNSDGTIDYSARVEGTRGVVRPAMWIRIS